MYQTQNLHQHAPTAMLGQNDFSYETVSPNRKSGKDVISLWDEYRSDIRRQIASSKQYLHITSPPKGVNEQSRNTPIQEEARSATFLSQQQNRGSRQQNELFSPKSPTNFASEFQSHFKKVMKTDRGHQPSFVEDWKQEHSIVHGSNYDPHANRRQESAVSTEVTQVSPKSRMSKGQFKHALANKSPGKSYANGNTPALVSVTQYFNRNLGTSQITKMGREGYQTLTPTRQQPQKDNSSSELAKTQPVSPLNAKMLKFREEFGLQSQRQAQNGRTATKNDNTPTRSGVNGDNGMISRDDVSSLRYALMRIGEDEAASLDANFQRELIKLADEIYRKVGK